MGRLSMTKHAKKIHEMDEPLDSSYGGFVGCCFFGKVWGRERLEGEVYMSNNMHATCLYTLSCGSMLFWREKPVFKSHVSE